MLTPRRYPTASALSSKEWTAQLSDPTLSISVDGLDIRAPFQIALIQPLDICSHCFLLYSSQLTVCVVQIDLIADFAIPGNLARLLHHLVERLARNIKGLIFMAGGFLRDILPQLAI